MPQPFKIVIYERELDNVAGWVLDYPDLETGGSLFGFWTRSGAPTVQLMLGPGPRARHDVTSFHQDKDYLTRAGSEIQHRHALQHLGDWHSHHRLGLAEPSSGDIATARRVFDDTGFDQFILCIANIRPSQDGRSGHGLRQRLGRNAGWTVQLGAFLFERDVPDFRVGSWVVQPGASPISDAIARSGVTDRPQRPSEVWQVRETSLESRVGDRGAAQAAPWYTYGQGKTFLEGFHRRCSRIFAECRAVVQDSGDLDFVVAERPGATRSFVVRFPRDFPRSPATVSTTGGPTKRIKAPAMRDAEFFAQLSSFMRRRNTAQTDVREESIDGLEHHPTAALGPRADDPAALLPDPDVVQPDAAGEHVSRRNRPD